MAMVPRKRENKTKAFDGFPSKLKLLLLTTLVFSCVVTFFHFNSSSFPFSTSDLSFCISLLSPPTSTLFVHEQTLANGTIKRFFNPIGSAAYSFITMSAYRGGPNTFAIVGLSSKPLQVYGNPTYECEWIPSINKKFNSSSYSKPITSLGYKMLPDAWDYGRVYTFVVINCTFNSTTTGSSSSSTSSYSSNSSRNNLIINGDNNGGKLVLYASTSGGGDAKFNITEKVEVLEEEPGSVDFSRYEMSSRTKYDYFYCGSPLFGDLSPQRVREWIAYHVRFFGPNSHFMLYDAGGIHEEVMEVLRPWIELGYVTIHDIKEQERFDGFYHNQFMVLNDCLHRFKFVAKWMFFFDVDEYMYVPPNSTLENVLDHFSAYSQLTIKQMPMNNKICLSEDYGKTSRKWGFEKHVYRDATIIRRRDRKYAVQPRNVFATGVHFSIHLTGETQHNTVEKIMYFHYHGAISERRETCKVLVNSSQEQVTYNSVSYVLDTRMRDIARQIKNFELKMIGSRLENTRL